VLHETLCRLEGKFGRGARGPSTLTGDVALNGADHWEFLYWNLTHSDSAEVRATYVRYAQAFLPNFPAEALLEWPGRHGYNSMNTWGFLPLERLRFSDEQWSMTQLKRTRARDDGFTGIGPDSHGAGHVIRVGDWAAEDIRRNGTWSAPIVVLRHLDAIKIEGHELAPGFSLIEGHNRISRMLNMPEGERRQEGHRVLVATVGPVQLKNGRQVRDGGSACAEAHMNRLPGLG